MKMIEGFYTTLIKKPRGMTPVYPCGLLIRVAFISVGFPFPWAKNFQNFFLTLVACKKQRFKPQRTQSAQRKTL
jgi:hypothetical protein